MRIASGVRSSWLASATNVRSRANAASSRVEHQVERLAEPADLVVGRADREARAGLGGLDLGGAPAHPLDRPQRRRRRGVAGQRREQERDRTADQQRPGEVAQRVVAVVDRRADDGDERLALRAHRRGKEPHRVLAARRRPAIDDDRSAPRARECAGVEQRLPAHGRRAVDDGTGCVEDLGEVLALLGQRAAAGVREPRVRLPDQRADVPGARAQALLDRAVELGAEPRVHEQPGGAKHDRHRPGERERDANAHGQAGEPGHRDVKLRLSAAVVGLRVGVDRDLLVARAEPHVDRRAVRPADLDLPRGALLAVALDGVRGTAGHELQRGGPGPVGGGARGPAFALVVAADRVRHADASDGKRECRAASDECVAIASHGRRETEPDEMAMRPPS